MNTSNLLFKCIIGSHAYGTNNETSDVDYAGVYCQSIDDILGFGYVEQYNISKDETHFEIKRFIELLKVANPRILELLYIPEDMIIFQHDCWKALVENRHIFLTQNVKNSFRGFVVQQIKKAQGLNKKMNWDEKKITRKNIFDFCWVDGENGNAVPLNLFLEKSQLIFQEIGLSKIDHIVNGYAMWLPNDWSIRKSYPFKGMGKIDSTDLRVEHNIPKNAKYIGTLYFNKNDWNIHCKEYNEYLDWLQKRNVARYVDVKNHNQKIDGKNLLHCRRLLDTLLEIAETGTFNVRRPNPEYLLDIRKGKYNLTEIISQAEEDLKKIDELFEKSTLPNSVDENICQEILLTIRKQIYNIK